MSAPDKDPANRRQEVTLDPNVLRRLTFVKWLAERRGLTETAPDPEMITPPVGPGSIRGPRPYTSKPVINTPERPWDGLMGGI